MIGVYMYYAEVSIEKSVGGGTIGIDGVYETNKPKNLEEGVSLQKAIRSYCAKAIGKRHGVFVDEPKVLIKSLTCLN